MVFLVVVKSMLRVPIHHQAKHRAHFGNKSRTFLAVKLKILHQFTGIGKCGLGGCCAFRDK